MVEQQFLHSQKNTELLVNFGWQIWSGTSGQGSHGVLTSHRNSFPPRQ